MIEIYCSSLATGSNDGSDWINAFTTLQAALTYTLTDTDVVKINIDCGSYTISHSFVNNNLMIVGGQNINNLNNVNLKTNIIVNGTMALTTSMIKFSKCVMTSIVASPYYIFNYSDASSTLELSECDLFDGRISNTNGRLVMKNCTVVSNSTFDNTSNIVINSGVADFVNTNVSSLSNTMLLDSSNITFAKCNIISTNTSLTLHNQSNVYSDTSVIKGSTGLILNNSSSYISSSTIDSGFFSNTNDNTIEVRDSIILGLDSVESGIFTIENSVFYPTPTNLLRTQSLTKRPLFKDSSKNDYTPMFGVGTTLEAFELTTTDTNYSQNLEALVLQNYSINVNEFSYIVNNIFTFTDYKKELEFATKLKNVMDYNYDIQYQKKATLTDQMVSSAFPYVDSGINVTTWPYEWDVKTFANGTIEEETYIVPKSVIDITETIRSEFLFDPSTVSLNNLQVTAVKEDNIYGISYDYDNSTNNRKMVWTLNDDATLIKTDMYSSTEIDRYHLLSKETPVDKYLIQISGVVPYGKVSNGYKYSLESNSKKLITGVDENFNFEWLPTDKTNGFSLTGILEYKDRLFITGKYTIDDSAVILVYPTKGIYTDYTTLTPHVIRLDGDISPSDMTVLEDGSFLISNKNNLDLYNYIPQYDYAKIISSNTENTKVLLREQYNNITLE